MQYEIVELSEKRIAGLKARTSNLDPMMGNTIAGLWQTFYEKGVYQSIREKSDQKSIGLYTAYSDNEDSYDVVVCCAVDAHDPSANQLTQMTIPSGKYARFVVKGHMVEACVDFWTKLPTVGLQRKYDYDFEEYQPGEDMENAEIHMYIGIL